ncbi:MAG: GntR family transcriptional regulator [Cytophagales bacterium]|nr:GntR family transcriptional regulator [Armatimonadota bacterium]
MLRTYRYETIAQDLRQQILAGLLVPQQRLPSERTLMQRFAVQRDTVRRALGLLEAEGWVITEQKRGSFVAPVRPVPPPAAIAATTGTFLVVTARNAGSTALESILRGLSGRSDAAGASIQYYDSNPLPGRMLHELPSLEFLQENQIAGVLLWPQSPSDIESLCRLRGAVPLLLVDQRLMGFEADFIGFDDISGGRLVTEHLLRLGHRRIGFLGDEVFAETVQLRWRGYSLALEAAGIPLDSADLLLFNGMQDPPLNDYLRLFLAGRGRPLTAVVCSNDSTALRLLRTLRAEGRRVPDEVAVTGYGDLLPSTMDAHGLTTVSQPFEALGKAARDLLVSRLGGSSPPGYQQIALPVSLIVRASTGSETGSA